jgi:hypothetical protein
MNVAAYCAYNVSAAPLEVSVSRRTCYRTSYVNEIRLAREHLGRLFENKECLSVGKPAFPVEVVAEEVGVWSAPAMLIVDVELIIRRLMPCWFRYLQE